MAAVQPTGTPLAVGAERPNPAATREFKRAYKACLLCRKSKAKCELLPTAEGGALSNGPCVKCRRERRACVFTATRSANKRQKVAGRSDEGQGRSQSEDVRSGSQHPVPLEHDDFAGFDGHPADSFASSSTYQQGPADTTSMDSYPPPPQPSGQLATQRSVFDNCVMRTIVTSSNDALGVLFQAVERQNESSSDDHHEQAEQDRPSQPAQHRTPHSVNSMGATPAFPESLSYVAPDVLRLWRRCRFVKQGWFSAREAVTYVDLFFKNCAPLTPILGDFYSHHSNHFALVTEEPLLCCTILMISSRIHLLPGLGGVTRAHFVHGRLWQHLEHLISRVIFGQEKISTAKTRTMGTIESFLLMTEWHPRTLHFPPQSDGWDFDLLSPDKNDADDDIGQDEQSAVYRWREEVFEPAKRSDRMSWMLLGAATSLAHELGILSDNDADEHRSNAYQVRKLRVRMLLFVYVNQLAARLGCTTLIPENISHSVLDQTSLPQMTALETQWYAFMSSWIEITRMMETVTDMFFPSPVFTRQLLLSGRYKGLLKHFQPLLLQWFRKSQALTGVSDSLHDLLYIDYHYIRMYINSLSIQAIVERALSQSSSNDPQADALFLASSISPSDYTLINEVIDACLNILRKTISLSTSGQLPYAPVRIYLRIVSASVFLLKAISLGSLSSSLSSHLSILDQCILALQQSSSDEMHLGSRYGTLIERHVSRFRRNFRVGDGAAPAMTSYSMFTPGPQQQSGIPADNAVDDGGVQAQAGEGFQMDDLAGLDDWLTQPFDPSIAPFGTSGALFMGGLELGSLDFLWNLPT